MSKPFTIQIIANSATAASHHAIYRAEADTASQRAQWQYAKRWIDGRKVITTDRRKASKP